SGMLSAFKYVVPFGTVSVLAMGVYEKRTDESKDHRHRGLAFGVGYEFGVGIWLNFLERAAAWMLDYQWSINNTYLNVSSKGLNTFGDLSYSENLFTAGITFEY